MKVVIDTTSKESKLFNKIVVGVIKFYVALFFTVVVMYLALVPDAYAIPQSQLDDARRVQAELLQKQSEKQAREREKWRKLNARFARESAEKKAKQAAQKKRLAENRERRAREYDERQARLAQEREARKNEKADKAAAQTAELEVIDKAAKAKGYAGYAKQAVTSMVYHTQRSGGLEKLINMVYGCPSMQRHVCQTQYAKLTVVQVMGASVLYTLSVFENGNYVSFTVLSDKLPGVMYQQGQSFDNTFHVFTGMSTYTTVLGAVRTVPTFIHVDLGL